MTVKQLIRKLSKLPEDAEVIIPNTADYIDGFYKATKVIYEVTELHDTHYEEAVLIDTDYERRVE